MPTKVCLVKGMVFSSSHVWMWQLDYKESWAQKNWYFWTVVLEKTLESPLDCKEIQPVHPKGNQSWIFTGRTDVEMGALILRPPDVKSQLIGKDHDDWKGWSQKEKTVAEDEMVRWHHWLNGYEFDHTQGDSKGQETWCVVVLGAAKSWTKLRDWSTTTAKSLQPNLPSKSSAWIPDPEELCEIQVYCLKLQSFRRIYCIVTDTMSSILPVIPNV